jgi:CDP-diacylglycerol---serine O-phosphatidyltransferase
MANGSMQPLQRTGLRRGIYILPNLFTSAALFAGFYGIIASLKGYSLRTTLEGLRAMGVSEGRLEAIAGGTDAAVSQYFEIAALAILVSALFDSMDGAVARLTRTASDFGAEFDSLADLVSFGVAPAILMYCWALEPFGRYGWLACFLYVICAALRLARFNVQSGDVEKKSFQGLPSPGAAGTLAVTVLFYIYLASFGADASRSVTWLLKSGVLELPNWVFLALTCMAALTMVSNVRYRSPTKNLDPFRRAPFFVLLIAVGLLILIAAEPRISLFVIFMGYFLSGPVEWFLFLRHRRTGARGTADDLYADDEAGADTGDDAAAAKDTPNQDQGAV